MGSLRDCTWVLGLTGFRVESAHPDGDAVDAGSKIDELHGRLSNIGVHCSSTRLKFASYELSGQFYDRVGAALDPSSAELALCYAPDACLQFLESIEKAYSQDSRTFPCPDRLSGLRERFCEVKARGSEGAA